MLNTRGSSKREIKIGERFGRLSVIAEAESTVRKNKNGKWIKHQRRFLCRCDCGKEHVVVKQGLTHGFTKSCGCLSRETPYKNVNRRRKPDNWAAISRLINQYKQGAKHRKLSFSLSREIFTHIITENCHYCGERPQNYAFPAFKTKLKNNIEAAKIVSERPLRKMLYSGIDRIDNSRGYEIDNVVPACKFCNRAKSDRPVEEFLRWIRRLMAFHGRIGHDT